MRPEKLTQEYVDTECKKALDNEDLVTIFEFLRAAEKGRVPLMNLPETMPEMNLDINWNELEKLCLMPTPRQQIENALKNSRLFQKLSTSPRWVLQFLEITIWIMSFVVVLYSVYFLFNRIF